MSKPLTIVELSLFMGAPCRVYCDLTKMFRKETINVHLLTRYGQHPANIIRPELRQRNDITTEELKAMNAIAAGYVNANSPVCQYQLFKYKLSIRLDLFDWIPEGLAIDERKLVKGRIYSEKFKQSNN